VEFLQYIVDKRSDLLIKTAEHLMLTGISAAVAVLVGVPLGILITRWSRFRGPVLGLAGVVQTIPSIAMLALLMIPLGLGVKPAIGSLILYALLPIIRNTYTGLTGVDGNIIEAADGMGFTSRQRLWMVELPLAAPVIIAGIRTATVITVGIATLSAYIGAGGLGDFIVRGLSTGNNKSIILGVMAASAMALLLDFGIGLLETSLKHKLHQE
jgi:osmoprotectant transport system permease protein